MKTLEPDGLAGEVSKEERLKGLKKTIKEVQDAIVVEEEKVKVLARKTNSELNRLNKVEDREHGKFLRTQAMQRTEDLERLKLSPMFAKFRFTSMTQREGKTIYISKQEFMEKNIYSWTAPVATIRFESPGPASYRLPNGQTREVQIREKEQYMIVDGKVLFFAREEAGKDRELIHQEHFSMKKGAFMLPEIVELMEKAQDAVIRAGHVGPFLISGPAGSGKTTLALHRVAYLAQAPETSALYQADSILVLVQDASTKDYFSKLLPELGIHDVAITTFFEWASSILKINESDSDNEEPGRKVAFVPSSGTGYEQEKLRIQRTVSADVELVATSRGDVFATLFSLYGKLGSSGLQSSFKKQRTSLQLDRIDVTLALTMFMRRNKRIEVSREYNRVMRGGRIIRKKEVTPLRYSLIVVDEFQNYMPDQLGLLRSCISADTKSIIYVGDMAQQVQHGTIRGWDDIGERVEDDRQIRLQKVYRNTQEILKYIQSLGFDVSIPEGLKHGPEVVEDIVANDAESAAYIQELLMGNKGKSIGVIGMKESDVSVLKRHFAAVDFSDEQRAQLRISTVREAQGVEFDLVCIVGASKNMLDPESPDSADPEFEEEGRKIQRDLLYIALTRSMSDMHVIGSDLLSQVLNGV